MREAIYKYVLSDSGTSEILLPKGARILDFQYQRHPGFVGPVLVMWAIVDRDSDGHIIRRFRIVATGETYDFKDRKYKKTLQDAEGFVWHIFEILA